MQLKVVILTGAGISAESGLKTFRDSGGLWEGYRVEDVATPEAWERNPELVLQFYNERRRAMIKAQPNPGHLALAELEDAFDVTIVTQNVDDLHERAGSTNIIHLHGELNKARSSVDQNWIRELNGRDIVMGERCDLGGQLRPHIVWFGEAVPEMERAMRIAETADYLLVIGTTLAVYPAAGLVDCVPRDCEVAVVDPHCPRIYNGRTVRYFEEAASVGVPKIVSELLSA